MPKTPTEINKYYQENKELPFAYAGENWLYDCYNEYQKRNGVSSSQFFTPDATADEMADMACKYFHEDEPIVDMCCGFGQLTKALIRYENSVWREEAEEKVFNDNIVGYDFDSTMVELYKTNTGKPAKQLDFENWNETFVNIISNPPYEVPLLTKFLEKLAENLHPAGRAILLIPKGFIDKTRPKNIAEVISKFEIEERQDMEESFARTGAKAEIVVLEKK